MCAQNIQVYHCIGKHVFSRSIKHATPFLIFEALYHFFQQNVWFGSLLKVTFFLYTFYKSFYKNCYLPTSKLFLNCKKNSNIKSFFTGGNLFANLTSFPKEIICYLKTCNLCVYINKCNETYVCMSIKL